MMLRTFLALALCLAGPVLAADDEKLEEKFEVVPHPALPGEVPAGSREDQILWRDARDAIVQGNETVRKANMALYDLEYARLNLADLEKGAAPADAERLRAIRARLEGPAKALDAAMPRGSLGRCRYEILYFEQSMAGDPGSELAARLPAKRAEARRCRDEHQKVIATLGPALKNVRAVLDEVGPELRQRMSARAAKGAPAKEATKDAAEKDASAKPAVSP